MEEQEITGLTDAIGMMDQGQAALTDSCHRLADKVNALIAGRDRRAGICLQLVADTYDEAVRREVKQTIESCFIRRLGTLMTTPADRRWLLALLPKSLHEVFVWQIGATA